VVMDLGSLLASGTFDEVMDNPDVRQAYLGRMGAS
jgi:ABC-type branched-subunit amino acid transport system ATPase component